MSCRNKRPLIGVAGPLSGERIAHAPLLHNTTAYLSRLGVDWLLEDDQATTAAAVAVAHRFIAERVDVVIGHFNSACAGAVLPLYRDQGIPLLLPASSQTNLTFHGGAFRLCSTDREQARLMAQAADHVNLSTIEIAIDGSEYSRRILHAFKEATDTTEMRIVHITEIPQPGTKCRLVFATCANAILTASFLQSIPWNGVVIYSDDAYVEEFSLQISDRDGINSFVIGPLEDYGILMKKACDLAISGCNSNVECLTEWLAKCGIFSSTGDAMKAEWKVYSLQRHSFVPWM